MVEKRKGPVREGGRKGSVHKNFRAAREFSVSTLKELVFPPRLYCACCGSLIDKTRTYGLCDTCVRAFSWATGKTCEKCGKPLPKEWEPARCHSCRTRTHYFDKGYTCASYGLYERMLVSDMKERGKTYLIREMGAMMADRFLSEVVDAESGTLGWYPRLVVPVPSGKKQIDRRGYDQAALLAQEVAGRLGVAEKSLLRRSRPTKRMRDLSPEERRLNVKDAFEIIPKIVSAANRNDLRHSDQNDLPHGKNHDRPLAGLDILLIDDVYTTGSTADECARVLKEAGAASVCVLTFAAGGNYIPAAHLSE